MALDTLATVADLTARGLTVEPVEEPVAETYLRVASSAVREAAGAPILRTTSTVVLAGEDEQWLKLPGQPVVAVTEVLLDGEPVTGWRLSGGRLWAARGWRGRYGPCEVEVTQEHGLVEVPDDIIDLVCRMVAAALTAHRAGDNGAGMAAGNVTSERIGDYAVTYGTTGQITEMELPDYWRERLVARFGGGANVLRSR